jgi:hypothetical protein
LQAVTFFYFNIEIASYKEEITAFLAKKAIRKIGYGREIIEADTPARQI